MEFGLEVKTSKNRHPVACGDDGGTGSKSPSETRGHRGCEVPGRFTVKVVYVRSQERDS